MNYCHATENVSNRSFLAAKNSIIHSILEDHMIYHNERVCKVENVKEIVLKTNFFALSARFDYKNNEIIDFLSISKYIDRADNSLKAVYHYSAERLVTPKAIMRNAYS